MQAMVPNNFQESCQEAPRGRGRPFIQLMKLHGKLVWVSEAEPSDYCSSYLSPPELCVYISICRPADNEDALRKRLFSENISNERFLAVHILHRTLQQFVEVISQQISNYLITKKDIKWKEVIHIEKSGRRVIVDDNFIKRLPQGQEICVSYSEQRQLADLNEDAAEYTFIFGILRRVFPTLLFQDCSSTWSLNALPRITRVILILFIVYYLE